MPQQRIPEKFTVELALPCACSISQVRSVLRTYGFKSIDDFCALPRRDAIPPWQAASCATVDFFLGAEPSGYGSLCDRLELSNLVASLPTEFAVEFVALVTQLAAQLGGIVLYHGTNVSLSDVSKFMQETIEEIVGLSGCNPGSEQLAIQIQESLDR